MSRLSRWSWPGGEAGDGEGDGEDAGEVGAGQLWWLHAGHCATNMLLVAVMPECRRATDSCDSQLLWPVYRYLVWPLCRYSTLSSSGRPPPAAAHY